MTLTSTSSTFKFFNYFPFPSKNNNTTRQRRNTTTIKSSTQQPSSKPACIAIVVGKDGTPVTKCIAPAVRRTTSRHCLSMSPTDNHRNQRRLSSFLLPKFRSCRHTSYSSKVVPFHNRFHQLPSELMIHIVTYLDLPSIITLSHTSKFCLRLCGKTNNYLWRKLYQTHYHPLHKLPLSYYDAFRDQYELGKRWQQGNARSHYLTGHDDSVYCLVWVNQHQVLSGSRDRSIKLWDVDQHECLMTRQHHQGSVLCLAISLDQSFFVSGSSDATLVCWSLPDMTPRKRLEGHLNGVLDVCLVDRWIVSSSRDTTVRVWNIDDGQAVHRLTGHSGPVNALEHVKHTHQVISASGDATLKLWDVSTAQCLRTFVGHQRGLACVRYDPFIQCIISGGQDGKIKIWDIKSADCLQTMAGHADLIRTVDCFQGNVVSGSYDRTLRVWNASTGACLLSFHSGHSSWIFNVLINSTKIISAGQDKKIMILDFGYDLKSL
ncbi:WD40-repeat-containing domain protein [Halteromyces radiatus]|uniref:WD40-repeat-containing domain protein n=1 Tax=Halteromyces radiatus TaxID=101107 RepID=UPI00221FC6E5|nr:WD40-repeat-containing domain protein [Halteromyces radiatus]KAI8096214.1 WD40-repeat-containing domain protein [Halteromyces radiatus]